MSSPSLREPVKLLKLATVEAQEESVTWRDGDVALTVMRRGRIGGQGEHIQIANGSTVPVDLSPASFLGGKGGEVGAVIVEKAHGA